jgi:N-acetyl-alpha-D-muramate 1-phosphate uridylyltransferase
VALHYSYEGTEPLETGGGMLKALDILGDESFIAVNGDIWSDVDYTKLPSVINGVVHLILVNNPIHHPNGDFILTSNGDIESNGENKLTFSGIGVYQAKLFSQWREVIGDVVGVEQTPPRFKIAPLLRHAMSLNQVSGEYHQGQWTDVGTPERLKILNDSLCNPSHGFIS